ncbi:MAG: nucleobase:cation symporter-2 family protein [Candidatus Methanofastidiosa archaeon]|nr:nucleobase:cation symporter-2 family protein [Candidatus Methanofastidiosa archaeon]
MSSTDNSTDSAKDSRRLRYTVNDKPPLGEAIPLAIQHVFAAFSGIVAVPLVVGGVLGLPLEDIAFLVSATLFVSGIATIIQTRGFGPVGARVPMIMGTDFTFVGPSISVGFASGLPGIFGATIAGSFIEMFLSRFVRPLRKLFPPAVTGTVVTLIGLTILPVAVDWAAGGFGAADYGSTQNLSLAMFVLVVIMVLNQWGKGIVSSGSILIGIILGYIVAYPLGLLDFGQISGASWIAVPNPLKFGVTFKASAILAFVAAYLVTTVETIGDLMAVGEAAEQEVTSEHLERGLLADGVGSFIAGFFNAGPNTSFSQNVGIIPVTGVASRFVVLIAGIIIAIAGLFPKVGALVAIMPNPVLGGAGIIMFGMIAAAGIKIYQGVDFNRRNMLVIAVSLGLGMAVVVRPDILSQLPEDVRTVFASGITTGTFAALILNLVLPKARE